MRGVLLLGSRAATQHDCGSQVERYSFLDHIELKDKSSKVKDES
jgi:hypothetical protein